MSLLNFTFDAERHIYHVPGQYVLSTSDIVEMCGIGSYEMIPSAVLANAADRGTALHKAIEDYEMGRDWQKDFPQEHMEYLRGYFNFRDEYDIQILPPMEQQYVYLHDCDAAIGCTIDIRFLYKDCAYIGDVKSVFRQYGKMLKQLQLKWRLQTQSYLEASHCDEEFWRFALEAGADPKGTMKRAVIHVHPKYKKGFEFYEFNQDDADLWRGAVLLASEKVAAGLEPTRKNVEPTPIRTLNEALEASIAYEDGSDNDGW